MLTNENSKEGPGEILGLLQKSVARMSALIDNVLRAGPAGRGNHAETLASVDGAGSLARFIT